MFAIAFMVPAIAARVSGQYEDEEEAPPPPPRRSTANTATNSLGLQSTFARVENDYVEREDVIDEEAPPPPPRRSTTHAQPNCMAIPAVEPCVISPTDIRAVRKQADGLALLKSLHGNAAGSKSAGEAPGINFAQDKAVDTLLPCTFPARSHDIRTGSIVNVCDEDIAISFH